MSDISDYIVKDYESFREMMINELKNRLPSYTDTSQTDAGIVIIELLARGLDILSYYQDTYANEALLPTCELRSSALRWCNLLGYTPKEAIPSKVSLVFEKSVIGNPITIPMLTQVATSDGIIFETVKSLYIPSNYVGSEMENGEYLYSVEAVQGYTVRNEYVGVGNGLDNQSFTLKYSPGLIKGVTLDSENVFGDLVVTVTTNNITTEWTRVDSFIASTKDSTHYVATINEYGQIVLTFGSNLLGKVPTSSDRIEATYRVGGGVQGNVAKEAVKTLVTSISGISKVYNTEAPTVDDMGYEQESLESIKINAPIAFRTLDRAVTLQDHSDLLLLNKNFEHVKSVKTYNKLQPDDNVINEGNNKYWKDTVQMYVQFYPDYEVTETSLSDIQEFIASKQMIGTFVDVFQAEVQDLTINATLIEEDGYNYYSVLRAVKDATYKYVSNRAFDVGQEFSVVSYEDYIKNVEGVKYYRVSRPIDLVVTATRGHYIQLDDTEDDSEANPYLVIVQGQG